MKNKKFSFWSCHRALMGEIEGLFTWYSPRHVPSAPAALRIPLWASQDQGLPPPAPTPSPQYSRRGDRQAATPLMRQVGLLGMPVSLAERLPLCSAGPSFPSEPSWCPLIGSRYKVESYEINTQVKKQSNTGSFLCEANLILFRTVSEMWCYYQNLLFREVIISIVF